ncbi:hypothetical protein HX109_15365 [Galbibacter sp. BG1]|uniref:hypothetical protein n=1 Tax=Galbibacter sp. BG1 TaxID=1170699 RepID=UPI0015BAE2B6|nr:hypothetical protein [Galbibacter sp. BG1]QLE02878.1 hypothetical protein HX109_15365 [Galbibacter sp. BG1]
MAESTQHRIFVGNSSKGIDVTDPIVKTPPFTADRTDIFADSTLRTADENFLI